jgi:hypothetical protein
MSMHFGVAMSLSLFRAMTRLPTIERDAGSQAAARRSTWATTGALSGFTRSAAASAA